ncbi:unnamed protein product [Phytomonas sp. EM1]|nr:unnamed protein product [Phytomonas sp. EM1]|eukprot:CCW62018.1 unnamed protein product [Phytomonas sp. isolate EM1]
MPHIELLTNVKLLTELLWQYHVSREDTDELHSSSHGAFAKLRHRFFSFAKLLLEVMEALVQRVCGLSRDKQIAALTTCLKKMIVDFATLLTTFQEPASAPRPRPSFETSKVTIFGVCSNEEPLLDDYDPYIKGAQQYYASKCTLSHLAGMLVKLLQNMLSKVENVEVYYCLLLLSDVYESCAVLRAASCDYVVDFLRLYTTEALARQSSHTLEVYLYLLHQLFAESRQRPDLLENLSKNFRSLSPPLSKEHGDLLPPQLPVFISSFCATIERHSEAQITIRNALSLMHFVVSLETTSEVVFGDPDDPVCMLAAESTLHHVAPLILHPSAEVGLLACDTVRLLMKKQPALGISAATREWVMDLALEGIQLASKSSTVPLIGLLNTLCDGCSICPGGEAAFEPTASSNPNVLVFIIQLAGFANDAFQEAINGSFLQEYLKRNAANVDTYAEQILHACGEHLSLPFRSFARLLYLVSGMSTDVVAIRPEISSLLVQHFLRQLEVELASSLGPPSPSVPCKGESWSTLEVLFERSDRGILNLLGHSAFRELLHTVCYFLPVSDELPPLAVQLLVEMRQDFSDWHVMGRVESRECAKTLSLVHGLMRKYKVSKGSSDVAWSWWCSHLDTLLQEGLLDWLLLMSVGQEDEDVERQRGSLIQCLLGEDKCAINEDMTRGAASCKELLLRDVSSHRISYFLVSLAVLGCPTPLDKDEMSMLLAGEFCSLLQLLVDQQAEFLGVLEQTQSDSGTAEGVSMIRSDLSAIIDTLSNVLRISAAYYKYFGSIPMDLSFEASAKTSDSVDRDSSYALIVRSPYLRAEVHQLMLMLDSEACAPQPLEEGLAECNTCATCFSNGQLLEELLQSTQLGRLALHILLALLITGLEGKLMVCPLKVALWHRWLRAAAASDAGNSLFDAFFRSMRELHRIDSTKQASLLRLLNSWVCSIDLSNSAPLRVCLLERHVVPHILTDRSRSYSRDVGSDMAMLLINTLSPLPRTQSSTCDVVIFKWSVHALTMAWTAAHDWRDEPSQGMDALGSVTLGTEPPLPLNILVLLHLLLERAHGREMSRRYGEVLLPVLLNIQSTAMRRDTINGGVRGFHAATAALVCGLLKDRLETDSTQTFKVKRINGEGSFALATEALRRCWICLQIHHFCGILRRGCKETQDWEEGAALLLRLKAQVVSAFQFIFLSHTGPAGGDMREAECACDATGCLDDEYHAALCLVNWCMELVLARDTVWMEPSCHVIYVLFNHYRATLATSQEALALYLFCLKCGPSMLSTSQLGVLLSALLYAAPHLPWSQNGDAVHELVHHFLTTVDLTALSAGLACSQLPRGTKAEEVLATVGDASATAKMYKGLSNACRYYAQAIPQAQPLSLHRLTDFLAVLSSGAEGSSPVHLFVQNKENVDLFSEHIPL